MVTCSRCGEAETAAHIFLHCRFTKRIWKALPLRPIDLDTFNSFEQAIANSGMICLPPSGVNVDLFPWLCWCIWLARNSLTFEKLDLCPEDIICKTLRPAREWQDSQPPKVAQAPNQRRQTSASDQDTVICYTDAAWKPLTGDAGFGWIFQDSTGQTIGQGSSTEPHVASALMAEAIAIREALLHARTLHYSKICIRSDNQVLTKALNSKQHPVEIYGLTLDIETLSSLFSSMQCSFISRSLNISADKLVKSALCNFNSALP
ncbi:uncharacterized protein LOC106377908 [Brassica napus]|nr:PREDICTED: uncharacterized protein LOC106323465 [Brassica oleracea var. oleracea]XP_013673576.2 uncharacterized protein LOC106377908 [Brassica napus]